MPGRSCRHYGKALEIQLKAVGEKHPNVGTTYSNQGAVYFSLGQCAQPSQATHYIFTELPTGATVCRSVWY